MKKHIIYIPFALLAAACSDYTADPATSDSGGNDITASVIESTAARTMADEPSDGVLGVLWTDGDRLGVFDAQGRNHTLYEKRDRGAQAKAVFATTATGFTPKYAYYPYNEANDGRDAGSLSGTVPSEQKMDDGNIYGDYKYGVAKTSDSATGGYRFEFRHMFSLVKAEVDPTGSDLAGETLKSIEVTASRSGSPVGIAGDFTFNARNGSYTPADALSLSSSVTMTWEQTPGLTTTVYGYLSLFPTVRAGDRLTFKVTTDRHIATFTVTSKIGFEPESLYLFPLTLSKFESSEYGYTLTDPDGNPVTPTEPTTLTGTFTAATYNVDGLPSIANSDGPGSSGTTTLGKRVNSDNIWDFWVASEDFEYDSQLTAALTNYSHGTYRGSVGLGQAFGAQANTDGLNMFWKNNIGITVSNETYVEYNDKEGDLYHGANTCIKKGFRYYLVTLKDGTEIDVYITHMNTFSGSDNSESNKYVAAVHSQLKQVRDYMIANMRANKRPAIFMGDTNMRYTRHKLQEYFMDYVNAIDGFSVVDPWCSITWNGDFSSVGGDSYPAYGGKSLMVSDATGTNADTDIIISEAEGGLQKGEVVDKIFYVNCRDAKTQLKAKSYLRDTSYKKADGSALADHYPVVVEFEYTTSR